MTTRKRAAYRGSIPPEHAAAMSREALAYWAQRGYRPQLAGADGEGVAVHVNPFGFGQDDHGRLVVDDYVNPPAEISENIAALVEANEGYWITEVYNNPGLTLNAGAVRYSETFPEDHFLDPAQDLAPRAPGAEAPRIGAPRRARKVAFAESWSGSIEIHDEVRRWNRVDEVQDLFQRTANSFGERLQSSGEGHLADFVTASNRIVVDTGDAFSDWAGADPASNTTSTTPKPAREFARVHRLFVEDKAGITPDVVIVSPEDAEAFDNVYEDKAQAVLDRYGLRMRVSVRRPSGQRLYLRAGQVGSIAFDVPLGEPEYTREGTRKTDVYTLETTPVFIPRRADSILEVQRP